MQAKSRFGCFGCFWVVALLFGTAVQVGLLWWLSPQWLQRIPFLPQRGSVITEEIVVAAGDDDQLPPAVAAASEEQVILWPEVAVKADYSPRDGVQLTTIEGSTFSLPPGAIRDPQPVEVVPVVSLPEAMAPRGYVPWGPAHDLRVGGEEHWQFDQPVRITMPFSRDLLPDELREGEVAIAFWDDDCWQRLPTLHSPDRQRLTAESDHASIFTTIVITTTAGILIRFTEPVDGLITWVRTQPEHTYKTESFAIHYDTEGNQKVPSDREYLLSQRRRSGAHPLFVVDVGTFLEESKKSLNSLGMTLSTPPMIRWDAFILDLPPGINGKSALGGPLIIDNDFSWTPYYEWLLRKTCIHELVHVAQDAYFNTVTAAIHKWWIEATAEYLAIKGLEKNGFTDPEPYHYIDDLPELLRTPMYRADGSSMYAYARFLTWLEGQGIDVVRLIGKVNAGSLASPVAINRALGEVGCTRDLGELVREFAIEMHHQSLWRPKILPAYAVNKWLRYSGNEFALVAWKPRGKKTVSVRSYAELQLKPSYVLSAYHFLIQAKALPARRHAQLVIDVSAGSGSLANQEVLLGTMANSGSCPFPGSPVPLRPVVEWGLSSESLATQGMAAPVESSGNFNRASLLLVNTSLTEHVPALTLRRWLLMAPEWITWGRAHDGSYSIAWHAAELAEQAKDKAFAGYNIYRRRWQDPEFPARPINSRPHPVEWFVDRPPEGATYAYTATVVDTLGNESAPAPIDEDGDPFEGVWEGKLRLTRGSISEPAVRAARYELHKESAPGADLSGMEQLLELLRRFLQGVDLLFRIGIPMTYQVERVEATYRVTPIEVLGQPVEDPEPLMMARVGLRSLAVTNEGKIADRGHITVGDNGRINQSFEGVFQDPDIGPVEYGLKLIFRRQQPAAAAPIS